MNARVVSQEFERSWPHWMIGIVVVASVMAIGSTFPPGTWYEQLAKPTWQPPAWVFAPVWTLIYATLAASLALLLAAPAGVDRRNALRMFSLQLLFNAAWTPLFFGAESALLAFIDVVCLWIAALASALFSVAVRPAAAWLQMPNLLWVSFALVLNGVILALNW